jgi:predicted enzyme related to lactoylglutathione lyase
MLPATDLDRARDFYESKLGLRVDRDATGYELRVHAGGDTVIGLYRREPTKADHTAATFEVDDVKATVVELRSRGVTFEEYTSPMQTHDGIAERGGELGAWFKDSEGNILCVHQAA